MTYTVDFSTYKKERVSKEDLLGMFPELKPFLDFFGSIIFLAFNDIDGLPISISRDRA